MKAAIILVLFIFTNVLAGPSCDVKRVALDQEFEIKPGQEVLVEGANLRLRFEAVTDDSRCPVGVVCVWGGNARVALKLSRPGAGATRLELNTGMEPKQKLYDGHDIRLVKLEPKKIPHLKQGDYVATIVVSRK